MADFNTVRVMLVLAIRSGMRVHQLDIRTAFLHGEIDGNFFISPPPGLEICKKDEVLQLHKGLYGLKQSPRLWNDKWNIVMTGLGFTTLTSDECVFVRGKLWVLIYVDDILIMSQDDQEIEVVKSELASNFDVKDLGSLHYFLGVEYVKDNNIAFLSQRKYIEDVLMRFGMDQCAPVSTPMFTSSLSDDIVGDRPTEKVHYQELIGCLLFISIRTRPDISAAVGILCLFSANPMRSHLVAGKRILRYLKGTRDYALILNPTSSRLRSLADANWGNDVNDRKSTSGFMLQIGGTTVTWKTRKQSVVALSTNEAEFIASSEAAKDILWTLHLLAELDYKQTEATVLMQDNQGAIIWETVAFRNAKHVAIRGNFVRSLVQSAILSIEYCASTAMTADILTKPLGRQLFERHCYQLGVRKVPRHSQSKRET